jgi:hypothetical protein
MDSMDLQDEDDSQVDMNTMDLQGENDSQVNIDSMTYKTKTTVM